MTMSNVQNRVSATPRARHKACEALPAFGVGDHGMSFRQGLKARERATLDRALLIVGGPLRTGPVFASPGALRAYFMLQLGAEKHEVFAVMFLDTQHRAIAFENMFRGTLTQTSVYPREIVLRALHHCCAAVVLTHNHPSGSVQPSRADEALTSTLKSALALIDVRVLDHVIVTARETMSMAERGLL